MQTLAPIICTILGFVAWTIIVAGLFWAPKLARVDQKYTCPLVTMLRGGLFTLLTYMGFLFWADFFNILVFNQLGYGNIRYFLAPLLLAAVSGTIFIVGSAFTAPTKRTLIFFGALVGITFYFFLFSDDLEVLYEPVLYLWGFEAVVSAVWALVRLRQQRQPLAEPVLWDWSAKYKRIINPRVMLGLWVTSLLELLLFMEGYSLFAGFGELNYWLWVLGTLAVVGLVTLLYRKINRWKASKAGGKEASPDKSATF